jgi:hypothetical protein
MHIVVNISLFILLLATVIHSQGGGGGGGAYTRNKQRESKICIYSSL